MPGSPGLWPGEQGQLPVAVEPGSVDGPFRAPVAAGTSRDGKAALGKAARKAKVVAAA